MTTIDTAYGHQVTLEPYGAGGVRLRVATSELVDGHDVHLGAHQATSLVDALPGPSGRVDQVPNARGFYAYPPATTVTGEHVRVQESSAASGPHVWLFPDADPSTGDDLVLEFDATGCLALKSALETWLRDIPNRWDLPAHDTQDDL